MARRKYNSRRRTKKQWYDRTSVGDIARTAMSGVKYIKEMINVEAKSLVTQQSILPTTAGTVQHLSAISQGSDYFNRNGNSLLLKSLFHRHSYTKHPSATNTSVREIIFFDKQQVADTNVSPTQILETASFLSPLNQLAPGRFQVISDRTVNLTSVTKPYQVGKQFLNFKGKNIHIKYNGTAGSDIQKMGLYILHISSEATNAPTVVMNHRLSFYDN